MYVYVSSSLMAVFAVSFAHVAILVEIRHRAKSIAEQ